MYKVEWKDENEKSFQCRVTDLDSAMSLATYLAIFVVISGNESEIVGKFGVDSVNAGILPNGNNYDWRKRR